MCTVGFRRLGLRLEGLWLRLSDWRLKVLNAAEVCRFDQNVVVEYSTVNHSIV